MGTADLPPECRVRLSPNWTAVIVHRVDAEPALTSLWPQVNRCDGRQDDAIALAVAYRHAPCAEPLTPLNEERVGSGRNVLLIDPTGGRRPAGEPEPG
jgi:hypothetical protein